MSLTDDEAFTWSWSIGKGEVLGGKKVIYVLRLP